MCLRGVIRLRGEIRLRLMCLRNVSSRLRSRTRPDRNVSSKCVFVCGRKSACTSAHTMRWYILKVDNVQIASTMRFFSFNMLWLYVFSFFFPSFEMKLELITFPVSITTTHRMRQSIIKPLVKSFKHTKTHTNSLKNHVPSTRPSLSKLSQKKGVQ